MRFQCRTYTKTGTALLQPPRQRPLRSSCACSSPSRQAPLMLSLDRMRLALEGAEGAQRPCADAGAPRQEPHCVVVSRVQLEHRGTRSQPLAAPTPLQLCSRTTACCADARLVAKAARYRRCSAAVAKPDAAGRLLRLCMGCSAGLPLTAPAHCGGPGD